MPVVKNPLAGAGGLGDADLIPGSGRSFLENSRSEEFGGLQSMGLQIVGHN